MTKTSKTHRLFEFDAAKQLLAQDAFTLNFGHWPPVGLDVSAYRPSNQPIQFSFNPSIVERRGLAAVVSYLTSGGAGGTNGVDYAIWMHPLWLSTGTLGHEAVHVEQYCHGTYEDGHPNRATAAIAALGGPQIGTLPHVLREILCLFTHAGVGQRYYKNGAELQARLHEVIADGYADWGTIPTTKIELWAALRQSGIDCPKSIRDELQAAAEGVAALKAFKKNPVLPISDKLNDMSPVAQINLGQAYYGVKAQDHFWRNGWTALYGQLLEIYGDPKGQEKMDLKFDAPRPQRGSVRPACAVP